MSAVPPSHKLPQSFAVASLVLGLVGPIPIVWQILRLPNILAVLLPNILAVLLPSILAVILGHIGISRASHGTGSSKGMAIAGLVLGYIIAGLIAVLLLVTGASYLNRHWH
jgi:uncharacterized membrane protein